MSRHDDQRLTDILASANTITDHIRRGSLDDGLVYDAVRVRLIEIGEAVRSIDPALLAHEPDTPPRRLRIRTRNLPRHRVRRSHLRRSPWVSRSDGSRTACWRGSAMR